MTPEAIVGLTAAISMTFRFLEPIHHDIHTEQNIQEQRLLDVDKIIFASKLLLQQLGRPKYLDSIWCLWSHLSQGVYMLERTLWPTQAPETQLHVLLPPTSRPLSELMLDNFDQHVQYVLAAIEPLERLHQWFIDEYDPLLHADFDSMLKDSILIYRSIESTLRMKRRLTALLPSQAAGSTGSTTNPVDTTNTAPSADNNAAAAAEPEVPIANAAGEVLAWY